MRPAAALAWLAILAPGGAPALAQQSARDITLVLPSPLGAGEIAWIEVQTGTLSRGQQIEVTTADGQPLGVVSPFGIRRGQDAGIYILPVPASAIRDGRLTVRLIITQFGTSRAPTDQEVRSVKLTGPPR